MTLEDRYQWSISDFSKPGMENLDVKFNNKKFVPSVRNLSWKADDDADVVYNSSRNLHAVESGLYNSGAFINTEIVTKHVPLVSPGDMKILRFDNQIGDLTNGFYFNLHNNVWGTNFPMWFEENLSVEFVVSFKKN